MDRAELAYEHVEDWWRQHVPFVVRRRSKDRAMQINAFELGRDYRTAVERAMASAEGRQRGHLRLVQ